MCPDSGPSGNHCIKPSCNPVRYGKVERGGGDVVQRPVPNKPVHPQEVLAVMHATAENAGWLPYNSHWWPIPRRVEMQDINAIWELSQCHRCRRYRAVLHACQLVQKGEGAGRREESPRGRSRYGEDILLTEQNNSSKLKLKLDIKSSLYTSWICLLLSTSLGYSWL